VTAQTTTAPRTTNRPAGRNLSRIAAVVAAALLFALLMLGVRARWVPLEAVDRDLARALNRAVAPHPLAVGAMKFLSVLGSRAVLIWLIAIATVLLAVRRRYRLVVFLVVSGVGSAILDPTLKQAIGRLRPVVEHPVAAGGGNSFPSGHALGSFISYGALLLVFLPALPRRVRRPVIIALAVLVALIGFSRLALGVHFLSDVVGAWCLGVAWLGLTTYVFELHRHGIGRRVTQPVTEGLEPEAATDLRPTDSTVSPGALGGWLAAAGGVVAWVLTFGVLCAIGIPLARYRGGNGNVLGDTTIPHFLAAHRTATLDRISALGSEAGNTHMILAVGLIGGAAALAAIRRWRAVIFLLAVMFGELTLFLATAAIVDRARPDVPHLDGPLPTSSFPSGHVAATILLYAAFAALVLPRTRAWWRWVVVAIAVLMPVWVGLSRMYRGMHHPTDLLGSLVLAACWLAAMLYLVRPNIRTAAPRRNRSAREPALTR
jgi:undecaprenyl-diphosphatase